MAKDAQYYREYRARKKAERQETESPAPLFAMIEGDKEPIALDRRLYPLDHKETQALKTEVLNTMGDVIDFPPRPKRIETLEEQKETLICEVLEVAVARYEEAVAKMQPPKTVAQQVADVAKWLRNHAMVVAITTFLVCNTALLVFWQYSFYLASGYSVLVAVATATVMEVALVLQSCLFGASKGLSKVALGGTTVATLLVVAQLLHSGVATRTDAGVAKQVEVEAINKRIEALASLEANAIASIEAMDTKTYPTKIEAARNALNAPGGYSHQIAELRKELVTAKQAGSSVAKGQGDALAHQQWLLLLLNIVLAHVLGLRYRRAY